MTTGLALSALMTAATGSGSPAHLRTDRSNPEFDRDIRPILAENCYACHGPDEGKRKAKLRLDRKENALTILPNGEFAIVPGDPLQSKLVERTSSKDPDEVMPPVKTGKKLTSEQIALLRRWVADGAKWQEHWSFLPPERRSVPAVKNKRWPKNEIDHFILARLEQEGLTPSPETDKSVLLRRVSLDLTGLPPTPDQLKTWLRRPDPFSAAVDELLASPHFGERMAADWLDLARYADTHGFNNDVMRSMWRWRDWVINAFNRNLPYDRFITEQLAGDLLPKPTLDQLIATGFNRNHGINSEGGIIDEEYRVEYVADRVRTTSIAWLGLTMECARCHDHKFDPIKQKDFYRFFAFFNNVDESGEDGRSANAAPILPTPTEQQQQAMRQQRAKLNAAEAKMRDLLSEKQWAGISFAEWNSRRPETNAASNANEFISLDLQEWDSSMNSITNLGGGKPFQVRGKPTVTNGPLGELALVLDGQTDLKTDSLPSVKSTNGWVFSTWIRCDHPADAILFSTASLAVPASAEAYGEGLQIRLKQSGKIEVQVIHRLPAYCIDVITRETLPNGQWQNLVIRCDESLWAKGLHVLLNGEECFRDVIHDDLNKSLSIAGPAVLAGSDQKGAGHFAGALAGLSLKGNPPKLEDLAEQSRRLALQFAAERPGAERDPRQTDRLRHAWLQKNNSEFAAADRESRQARLALFELERDSPTTMVMREVPQGRPAFVLLRGQYDQPGAKVQPDVPEFLLPFSKELPRNRIGLAQWLTNPRNPLTARVVVNRFWQELFGTGIVKTSENFGYQGDWPSHRELLDWLAIDFVDSGWDVKKLLRLIVTSATYQQNSRSSARLNELDPENRLLAHGPRQRLTGEMLRDQALSLSGLLHDEIGGPPVFPYQPPNLYKGIVVAADYPGTTYTDSTGSGLYRRSLYTFWKRTVPHPSLSTFDVPDREVCVARRAKTNTPLQALAGMNDTIEIEAARNLAERMLQQGGAKPAERVTFAFQLATARTPKQDERKALCSLLDRRLMAYKADPAAAKAFLSVGVSKPAVGLDPVELAAYANVASLILNLDETITRN